MSVTLGTCLIFFFNDTATTEIYTLSLHDALPISLGQHGLLLRHLVLRRPARRLRAAAAGRDAGRPDPVPALGRGGAGLAGRRSEEHTSELQSRQYLVCRLLLEKKKQTFKHVTRPL